MKIENPTLDQMLEEPGTHAGVIVPYVMAGAGLVSDDDRVERIFEAFNLLAWLDGDADDDHGASRLGATPFHAAIAAAIFAAARIESLELGHTGRSLRSLERGTQARAAMERLERLPGAAHPLVADAAELARILLESKNWLPDWTAKNVLRILRRVAFDECDLGDALGPLARAVRSRERYAQAANTGDETTGAYKRPVAKVAAAAKRHRRAA